MGPVRGAVAAAAERAPSGEKVQRIVDAMRRSVAERGIEASTFDRVSRDAGVSRGLLHYYFGTKERLLIEVLRRDAELRIVTLDEPLARAATLDDVIEVLVSGAEEILREDPGLYAILFELFVAGRKNPEIRRELADLYSRSRDHVAAALRRKHDEGVLSLRFEAEACVTYMLAAADGAALQRLSDPERDFAHAVATGTAVARFLLGGE